MPDPATYRPAPGSIPVEPGVYRSQRFPRLRHLRRQGQEPAQPTDFILADMASLHPRTRQMVTTAARVEWTVVTTEAERRCSLEYN